MLGKFECNGLERVTVSAEDIKIKGLKVPTLTNVKMIKIFFGHLDLKRVCWLKGLLSLGVGKRAEDRIR